METLDTVNSSSPLAERVGYAGADANNPSKRKRRETGSVDFTNFEKMSSDERQFAMFEKLTRIEASQNEMRSMQSRLNQTCNRLDKTVNHVDVNTFRTHLLAYKYLDLDTKQRSCNIIIYGLEELERDGVRISTILRDFLHDYLCFDDEDLFIMYARRIGQNDNRGRRIQKRPILCTFSHYTEADMVMNEARRLKNTPYSIDRDYPPEIASARKQLWPEVKRLRNLASPSDSIQLKYPAKIVKNGQIVQDAFPHWDTFVKASVCGGDFRYITQDELLLPETTIPSIPSAQVNPNVPPPSMPLQSSGVNCDNYPGLAYLPQTHMSLMPPPLPPPPPSLQQTLFMPRLQNVNMRSTILQPNMTTSLGWRSPRPPRPASSVNQPDTQMNLPNSATRPDDSQQMSPSILSQSFQKDYSNPAQAQNNPGTITKPKQTLSFARQHASVSVSHSDDGTRDRSESVGRHDSRGRPRNVNNRSRSRSVKPRDKSTTGAAKAQQNKQKDKLNSSSSSEPISTQNKV